jgi:hypothetical protein
VLVEDAHTTGDAGALTAQQIIDHHIGVVDAV